MGLEIGQVLGSYRISGKIGEGGMGEVYRADHLRIARTAAIKVLRPELSSNEQLLERFFAEARATSLIRHPGIVEILDCSAYEGRAYIVMEFLHGEALAGFLRRAGALAGEFPCLCELGADIASAIGAAHGAGIVHRDLKPDNIFLAQDDRVSGVVVKILDFGIAKLNDRQALHTRTGSIMGTPTYMSPEQCRGCGTVDSRADIYALGCILFEMAAGRPPFVREGDGEFLSAHLVEPPPELGTLVSVLGPFAQMVAEMLAKDPDRRPQTMKEVEARLRAMMPAGAAQRGNTLVLASGQRGDLHSGKSDGAGSWVAAPAEQEPPSRSKTAPDRAPMARGHTPTDVVRTGGTGRGARRSTTLRSSTGEAQGSRSGVSRHFLLPALVAGIVLAAGAALILVRFLPSRQQTSSVPAVTAVVPIPKPTGSDTAAETVTISIEGAPPGLVARVDGVDRAFPIRLRKGSPAREYRLQAPQYEPRSVLLDGASDRVLVLEWRKALAEPGPATSKLGSKRDAARARPTEGAGHQNPRKRRLEAIEDL